MSSGLVWDQQHTVTRTVFSSSVGHEAVTNVRRVVDGQTDTDNELYSEHRVNCLVPEMRRPHHVHLQNDVFSRSVKFVNVAWIGHSPFWICTVSSESGWAYRRNWVLYEATSVNSRTKAKTDLFSTTNWRRLRREKLRFRLIHTKDHTYQCHDDAQSDQNTRPQVGNEE